MLDLDLDLAQTCGIAGGLAFTSPVIPTPGAAGSAALPIVVCFAPVTELA